MSEILVFVYLAFAFAYTLEEFTDRVYLHDMDDEFGFPAWLVVLAIFLLWWLFFASDFRTAVRKTFK